MEIEQMKELWGQLSQKVEQQEQLTDQLILDMTQERYTNRFDKILTYESIGAVICFIAALFLMLDFDKLDTWYLKASGIFILLFLISLPILVLRSLIKIKSLDISQTDFRQTIVGYERAKNELLVLQRFGIYLSFVLALLVLPVSLKIFKNQDFFKTSHDASLWIAIGVFFIFLIFFAKWGYGCYQRITNSAEDLLKDLEKRA